MKDAKLTPRIAETARGLWGVYFGIALACTLAFRWAGMTWPDAFMHMCSTMGLGGFSSHDASFGYWNSPLIEATADEYRLVRVRAAAGIAAFPRMTVPPAYQEQLKKAEREYLASITARPDQWTSHYNLGNYQLGRGENKEAVASFEKALAFEPQAVTAMVNASIAHARLGEIAKAEKSLQKALKLAPDNAAANFNMGLLKAEKKENATVFPIEILIPKASNATLRAGYSANANIIIRKKDNVLTLPERVVTFRNDSAFVKVALAGGKVLALMESFEDHDDVQNVYANFDIPDEIVKGLEA